MQVKQGQNIQFSYVSLNGEKTERSVRVIRVEDWGFLGFCALRDDYRNFRHIGVSEVREVEPEVVEPEVVEPEVVEPEVVEPEVVEPEVVEPEVVEPEVVEPEVRTVSFWKRVAEKFQRFFD